MPSAILDIAALPSHREIASRSLGVGEIASRGLGDIASAFGGVVGSIATAVADIAQAIPGIEAASGLKSAQAYQAQQAALEQEKLSTQIQVAQEQSSGNALKVAAGLAGGALAGTLLVVGIAKLARRRR